MPRAIRPLTIGNERTLHEAAHLLRLADRERSLGVDDGAEETFTEGVKADVVH
jgi:hypothetical protein